MTQPTPEPAAARITWADVETAFDHANELPGDPAQSRALLMLKAAIYERIWYADGRLTGGAGNPALIARELIDEMRRASLAIKP